jgi:hypothetical protein
VNLRSVVRTTVAIVGVEIAMLGCATVASRPWTLAAQLPALLLILVGGSVFAASRQKGAARGRTVLVTVSIIVALYAWEVVLALDLPVMLQTAFNPAHDRRPKREVVLDLRRQGDAAAVPIVQPSLLIFYPGSIPNRVRQVMGTSLLPLGGMANRTTVLCNESGKYAIYRADEHGFRNPHGAWSVPPRVAVVGDSFSHGHCVDDGDDWVGGMRKSTPQVLNLAMGGNGPLLMLATLREYLPDLEPRVVIWQYFDGHDARIPGELKVPILRRYLEEPGFSQGLVGRQSEADAIVEEIAQRALREPETRAWLLIELQKFLKLTSLRTSLTVVPPAEPAANLTMLARILREAKRTVDGWRGKMYFVYLPDMNSLKPGAASRYASRDQVVALARNLGLEVLDLDPVFRSHPDPFSLFPYRRPLHYNARGYAIVADRVLKSLTSHGLEGAVRRNDFYSSVDKDLGPAKDRLHRDPRAVPPR